MMTKHTFNRSQRCSRRMQRLQEVRTIWWVDRRHLPRRAPSPWVLWLLSSSLLRKLPLSSYILPLYAFLHPFIYQANITTETHMYNHIFKLKTRMCRAVIDQYKCPQQNCKVTWKEKLRRKPNGTEDLDPCQTARQGRHCVTRGPNILTINFEKCPQCKKKEKKKNDYKESKKVRREMRMKATGGNEIVVVG